MEDLEWGPWAEEGEKGTREGNGGEEEAGEVGSRGRHGGGCGQHRRPGLVCG
jgi:hypothetical protein